MTTLFDKLGGKPAVNAVVDKFYELMLSDQEVQHFFEGVDMGNQSCRMKQFITLVTGGPNEYEGADMKTAHCKFEIWKNHFDRTWKNL